MYEKIKKLAYGRGVRLTALERVLGFGNGTICKWKTATPKVDKVKKVADYFGVSVDELLEEDCEGKEK